MKPTVPARMCECPGCGTFQLVPALTNGMSAQCAACGTLLQSAKSHTLDRSIALTVAALALLVILSLTTMLSVETAGIALTAGLFSGPVELVHRGMPSLAIVVTFILLKILDATMGLRVSQQDEIQGLDLSQHGEEGYIFI